MNITSHTNHISATMIDNLLFFIEMYLSRHYGFRQAQSDLSPLKWYINSNRATLDFLGKLVEAKPFMIGRKLHEGGSYEEAIDRVCDYIGYTRHN